MQHQREFDGTDVWTSRRGLLRIQVPTKGILVVRFRGDFIDEFAAQVAEATYRVSAESEKYTAFHDWEAMSTYETSARIRLTNVALQVRQKTEGVHLLVGSPIVAAGVQVANLIVRMITTYTDRGRFDAALSRVLVSKGASSARI